MLLPRDSRLSLWLNIFTLCNTNWKLVLLFFPPEIQQLPERKWNTLYSHPDQTRATEKTSTTFSAQRLPEDSYTSASCKNGHMTAHLTDKVHTVHLRCPLIPFRQGCTVSTGTRCIDGLRFQSFQPLEIFLFSHAFQHTQTSPGGHRISHTLAALQRDMCSQDVCCGRFMKHI